jgi:hypothetical protein
MIGCVQEGTWQFASGTDGEVGGAWVHEHVRGISEGFAAKVRSVTCHPYDNPHTGRRATGRPQ